MDTFRALCSRGISWAVSRTTDHRELCSRGISWAVSRLTALNACSREIAWAISCLTVLYAYSRGIAWVRSCLAALPVLCSRLFTWLSRRKTPESVPCQVECYGQGNVHTDIMKSLNISVREKPGIPLVLFVCKVSRETVDLRNALQWIEDNRGRKREDICAVILLEKSSDTDKKAVEVADLGMFDQKTAVVRILWEHQQTFFLRSCVKIQKGLSSNREMDIIKQSILGWQSSPAGGDV